MGDGLCLVAGSATPTLAAAVAETLGVEPTLCTVERFPDGELRPAVAELRASDVYVVQSTCPPVNENLVELLLILDACRRGGAERITAVVPYFGYARQDRRTRPGQAIGARVVADALAAAGADRLLVVDPHVAALEAVVGLPTETGTAVPTLAARLASFVDNDAAIVAPDLGAVKLAESYAAALDLPVAVVRKTRLTGSEVQAEDLVGDVEGRLVVVVDDMISTGATIVAAAQIAAARGATPDLVVAATHGPLSIEATKRLGELAIRGLLVTDTCTPLEPAGLPTEICSVAPAIAAGIAGFHRGEG